MSDFDQREQQVGTQYNAEGGIYIYQRSPGGKPLHRPARAIHFTDRKTELEKLLADLQPGRIVTLCGPGGIGKSALAAEALWRLAPGEEPPERFPDGIVFHSFYGQPNTDLALESIARAFGEEPKPSPASAAQRALAGKRALLILDGTEDADDLPKVQAVAGGCAMLVTSRRKRDAATERADITPLERNEAVELLRAWGGDQVDDEAAARRISELVGGLPLAVRLVGRYLSETGETATEYLQWLKSTPLEALDPDSAHHRMDSVPWLLQRSLEQLSRESQDALSLAGQLALNPFEQDMFKEVLQLSTGTVKRAFRGLTDYGLLLHAEAGRYELSHALIHTYAQECLRVEDEALARLVDYAIRLAKTEAGKGLKGYRRLDAERPHLLRLLDSCVDRDEWEAAEHLARAIEDYLDIQGYWTEWLMVNETGLQAAREQGNRKNEGAWMGKLGLAYYALGQVEQAIGFHEQALLIAREIGDRRGEGGHLGNLGNAYRALEQAEQAIGFYEQALVIAREIGDRRGEGIRLGNLGNAYYALGQVEQAIGFHEQALLIAREIGDRRGEGGHLGNLGNAYYALGQVEQAIGFHEQALVIAREIGHRHGEANHLVNLGNAYSALGQVEKAIGFYEQALVIAREIGDRRGEGNHLGNLGNAYGALEQVEQAIGFYEQALVIAREIGDRRGEGNHLGNLGNVYYALGQVEKAIGFYEQALLIAREIGHRTGEGNQLGNLGLAYSALEQVEQAIGFYEQALVIAREIGDRRGEGHHLGNLGIAYSVLGQEEKARKCWEASLAIFEEIKSPYAQQAKQWLRDLDAE